MNNLKYVFDFMTIPIFLVIFFALIILCVIALYYMSTNMKKQKEDYSLRVIVFQMIIATFIQNISRIILFIITIFFEQCTPLLCQITESFIETTTATIPFLFSSYIIVYFKRIFPSSIEILSITQLNILFAFVNWILPCFYWVLAIWFSDGLIVHNDTCMYSNYVISLFHNGCCLLMNVIGVGVGYLMKRRLWAKGKKMESGLKNKVFFYIVMNAIYSMLFAVRMYLIIVHKKESVNSVYNTFDNVIFCLLPAVFFVVFCFECKCRKKKHLKEDSIPNELDSSFEEENKMEETINN
jgi:hypothetical protein